MATKRLGKSQPSSNFLSSWGLNPKTGAIENAVFLDISKEQVVFRLDRETRTNILDPKAWDDLTFYKNEFDKLIDFSRIQSEAEIIEYAKANGPLFGSMFSRDGLIREPLYMWRSAINFLALGMRFHTAYSDDTWEELQPNYATFEIELHLDNKQLKSLKQSSKFEVKDNQPMKLFATTYLNGAIPEEYIKFTL